jgi:phosphoserine phosphatase RsbX
MRSTGFQQQTVIDYSVAARPCDGESVCGDVPLIQDFGRGVLLAVIDGAGHGELAAAAAAKAAEVLQQHADEAMIPLLERCHLALRRTRGAAMTVVSYYPEDKVFAWIGVGNVEACLFRADPAARPRTEGVLLRGGVVGYQLPPLRASLVRVQAGDLLVVVTDGIRADFSEHFDPAKAPEKIARQILAGCFKGTDDALVLAARFRGGAA